MASAQLDSLGSKELEKLQCYHALLLKWQDSINLISPKTIESAWKRHFEDSLQLLRLLPQGPTTLFDLGSGAGFPGLVLACAREDIAVHLIESDQKKCTFMRTVSRETKTPVQVHNARIESFEGTVIPDVVSARALASLPSLLDYIWPWAKKNPDLLLLLPKGENYQQEVDAARETYDFSVVVHGSETSQLSAVLELSGLCKKDSF